MCVRVKASLVRILLRSPVLLSLLACSFDDRDLEEREQDNGGEGGGGVASGGASARGGSSNAGVAGKGSSGGSGGVSGGGGTSGASNSGGTGAVAGPGESGAAGSGGTSAVGGASGSAGTPDTGEGGVAGESGVAGEGSSAGGGAGAPGVDPCATNPCANGGSCVPDGEQAACRCEGGFTGATCTTKILNVMAEPGCRAEGISGEGTVLAGACIVASASSPFSWSGQEGDAAEILPLTNGATEGGAVGVNRNGLVIVGWSGPSGQRLAVRWVNGVVGGYQRLSSVEYFFNRAQRTDEDGSVTVGVSQRSGEYDTAVRWTTSTATPVNVEAGGPHQYSFARGVSADGTYVVGYGTDEGGAFTWTAETGYQALSGLDGAADNRALGVSDDGAVVVGTSGGIATRWTARVPTSLGSSGEPLSASADGSVIVGRVGAEAFLWTEVDGIRTLASELVSLDVDLGDFVPSAATDVSDDGRVIAGYGTLNGADHAFSVRLPAP